MSTTSATRLLAAAVALTIGAGASALAADKPGERHLVEAKRLIGVSAVQNEQGKRIGQVEDIVLERDADKVAYVVVSVDPGWLKGEKLYAIPWESANVEPGWNTVRFSVSPEQVNRSPGFNENNWPEFGDRGWRKKTNAAYTHAATRHPDDKDFSFRRVSKLIGTKVENQRNEDFGKIADVLIDDRDGRVAYAVVAQGGVLGMGDKRFPVPWTSFNRQAWKERLVVNASREDVQRFLQQPVETAQLENRSFADRVAGVFGGGRAGRGADDRTGGRAARHDDGTFRDDALTRISGEIVAVTMPGTKTSNEPVRLRVKTAGNREFRVEAAPRSFLDNRIQLVRGRQITVTGSLRRGDQGEVLVAKELMLQGGASIAVRDDQGRPLWAGPDFMTGEAVSGSSEDDRDLDRGNTKPSDQNKPPAGSDSDNPGWRR